MMDVERSNEFVPYQLVRRALDPSLLRLRDAIRAFLASRSNAVVIDVGAGGGLLAAWAAECSRVGRVYAIEDDPLLIEETHRALARHPHRGRISVVEVDNLLTHAPTELCDLLLVDVLSTGLLTQPLAPLLNHYLPFVKPGGRVLPSGIRNFIELMDFDFQFADGLIHLPRLFEDGASLLRARSLCARTLLSTISFEEMVPMMTSAELPCVATTAGVVRCVTLSTEVLVGDESMFGGIDSCPTLVSPIAAPLAVDAAQDFWIQCRIPHRNVDARGRASAGRLPERLEIEVFPAPSSRRTAP